MGYYFCAECDTSKIRLIGTAFYGYIPDKEFNELASVKYLNDVLHINFADAIFNLWWMYPSCDLTASQFRTFIKLYIDDYEQYIKQKFDPRWFCVSWAEFNTFYHNEDTKHLSWG